MKQSSHIMMNSVCILVGVFWFFMGAVREEQTVVIASIICIAINVLILLQNIIKGFKINLNITKRRGIK